MGVIVLAILGTIAIIRESFSQKVVVINNTDMEIIRTTVSFAGDTVLFQNIKSGAKLMQNINATKDGNFDIRIEFIDGTIIERTALGYITTGDTSKTTFTIKSKDTVDFEQVY